MLCYWWSAYNILNSSVNEYSTTNNSNSSVGKYYIKKMNDILDFGVSEYWGLKLFPILVLIVLTLTLVNIVNSEIILAMVMITCWLLNGEHCF